MSDDAMPATRRSLPRTNPREHGVDARGVVAFLDAVDAAGIELHSMMLLVHGHVVAEGWWAPYSRDRVHLLYSLSKSFTSTALGFAVDEGLVSLDDTVLSHFPELDAEITDERTRRMLVRHVAAMASGHRAETVDRAHAVDPENLVRGFLLIPPDAEPGTVFAYNQPCTYTVGAIVARRSGQTLTDYLRPRLLDPLGIEEFWWQRDVTGQELGYSGLHATTDAVARLGLLYLQHGAWDGTSVLPTAWVDQATRKHVETGGGGPDNPDWQQGYGFQFWAARHGYRGDGAFGQFCVVLPEHHAVLAVTAGTENMQGVLDAAWEHLLPALAGTTPDDEASATGDAVLAERLARLTLAPAPGLSQPPRDTADRWGSFSAGVEGGPLSAVSVHRGDDGWDVTLHGVARDGSAPALEAELGVDGWAVSDSRHPDGSAVPLAVSGAWADGELQIDVVFLETPHRLRVRCSLEDGAHVTWVTKPLAGRGPLDLRAPRP